MNGSVFDYIICAVVICLFVYGWGRFKRQIAIGKCKKAHVFLAEKKYKDAIAIYQEIASEMQPDPEYWYNLALALAGAGSPKDSRNALDKLLRLKPGHEDGLRLREALAGHEE